ncbi:MAG: hypothetical protein RIS41_2247 [Actinomycetota bacterium]|jgi:uncharacterized protein YciI
MTLVVTSTIGGLMDLATVSLHIASMWPRPITVVEADPDGGRLAARHDWDVRPGLVDLATAVRSRSESSIRLAPLLRRHSDDVSVIVAPPAAEPIMASLPVLAQHRARLDEIVGSDVMIVVGRIRPDSPANDLVRSADLRLLVSRTDLEDVVAVVHRADHLRALGSWQVLTAGGRYDANEVARTVEWPVVADLLPDTPKASARLRQSIRDLVDSIGSDTSLESRVEAAVA